MKNAADMWGRLEGVLGTRATPLLNKSSRSVSPDLIPRRRSLHPQKSWSKALKKSQSPLVSKSQNTSLAQEPSRLYLELPSTRRQSPFSRPSTAPIRSIHLTARTQGPCFIEGLTAVDVRLLYKARCDDTRMNILPEQLRRFYEFCSRNVKNRKFEMQKCSLGPASAAVIGQLVRNNYCFSQVDLGRNALTDKGAVQLVKTLAKSTNLVHLGLSSNDISSDGAAAIFLTLKNHQSITSFDISSSDGLNRNRLATKGSEPLAVLLQENIILCHLNLAGTAMGPEGLGFLAIGLKGNRSLLALNLANNGLVGKTIEGFSRIVSGTKLKHLDLSANRLGNAGCEALARMLQGGFEGYCPLLALNISRNEITQAGASKIYVGLQRNNMLRTLIFDSNPLGPFSNAELLNFLIDNRAVSHLNMSHCNLHAEGVTLIGDGLIRNHSLQVLNLSWNSLEDAGAVSIALGLARNDSLKTLDLSSNRIKDAGGNALCDSLRCNRTLEALVLQDNNVHDVVAQSLSDITRFNQGLMKVVVKMNPISQKYLNEIAENVASNRISQKRSMTPLLMNEIKRLQVRGEASSELEAMERWKKEEEADLKRQLQEDETQYERVHQEEEKKFEVLQSQLEGIRRERENVKLTFAALEEEIMSEKQKAEKQTLEWETRIRAVANDIRKAEKELADSKQDSTVRRTQAGQMLAHLRDQLTREKRSRDIAQLSAQSFQKQIEQQLAEIEAFSLPPQRVEKTMLASQQLATFKRQQKAPADSPSPTKTAPKQGGKK